MSQALHTSNVPAGAEEQYATIERREKIDDWFFKLMIPAVFLFLIISTIALLL